ncbi:MAG: DUF3052 domain-containing protein [Elusimicrobia bacterium]|nr:DUF3052 domain-containing protein [Elusimicrobiota bacterium]
MAGYSGKPLVDKLGIKPGHRAFIEGAPAGYTKTLGKLPPGATIEKTLKTGCEFLQLFAVSRAELDKKLPVLKKAMPPGGMLWISWPKGASGVATDLTGDLVRAAGLKTGLVDVKVCAVDDTWSGLKFVYRLKDR